MLCSAIASWTPGLKEILARCCHDLRGRSAANAMEATLDWKESFTLLPLDPALQSASNWGARSISAERANSLAASTREAFSARRS
jgi:hypothetical protein